MQKLTRLAIAGLAAVAIATPVAAQSDTEQSVFIMGGPFTTGYFEDTFLFWKDHYETNFFVGIGYQNFLYEHPSGFKMGFEAGLGLRAGETSSAELWAGTVIRIDNLRIGDISIVPSLTAGFSVVTDTIGIEKERAQAIGMEVPTLFYLGPEIALSHAAHPDIEVFARVQHRSGGFGALAHIDGSNGAVLGLRYKF